MTRPGLLAWVADGYNGTGLECVLRHTCPPSSFVMALGTVPDSIQNTAVLPVQVPVFLPD